MENKNNFTGIIIPVIVAVILLTVLPIVNSMNVECPPCEECPSYNIGNIEVNPNFASGNYIVDKGSYDYIDSATIIKDVDLTPENIKKGVNIFGVTGTYEGAGGGFSVNISTNAGSANYRLQFADGTGQDYYSTGGYYTNVVWLKLDTIVLPSSTFNGITKQQALDGHFLTQNVDIWLNYD